MEIYTIGFTQRSASDFFAALRSVGIRHLVDTRLNNTSQLAAFAKRDDLAFFLSEILGATYREEPLLAPTADILDDYKKRRIDWPAYERAYIELLEDRRVQDVLDPEAYREPSVLLCSERTPERCHRRLATEYLTTRWPNVSAVHL